VTAIIERPATAITVSKARGCAAVSAPRNKPEKLANQRAVVASHLLVLQLFLFHIGIHIALLSTFVSKLIA